MREADLLSDERLVGLTIEGDREAFGQIVARYQSPICALAHSACGSITRSEDLAQEVFVAACRRLRELKEPAKLKAWLYAIARNLINSAFRQQSRNPLASADALDEAVESSADLGCPAEAAISKEEEAILWQVLSGMPEMYRRPMVLFCLPRGGFAERRRLRRLGSRQRLGRFGRAMGTGSKHALGSRANLCPAHGLGSPGLDGDLPGCLATPVHSAGAPRQRSTRRGPDLDAFLVGVLGAAVLLLDLAQPPATTDSD